MVDWGRVSMNHEQLQQKMSACERVQYSFTEKIES